ncbi:ankyrin repeat and MYND domain-containing protein 1 isoform X1 [Kryptolebias marmoratus]|uniref:ankyrin repeat and MYND domain-containing protein 1 isoform X1 n=1 Tax=Kryptolebias marmoratus TaxID=37003 RepID=UPI0007F8E3ED|nr:ankyrin repeat and MYND domain-containing protein 1 isoform X1 [Kryptolebias marmoratus]
MQSTTCEGAAGPAQFNEEIQDGFGVQEWYDGSRYEGKVAEGLRHGKGKYIWANGEYYEGCFFKNFRHGDALYSWPTGQKFIGKYYLNRKEGYGQLIYPDGASFQGLYHMDQRFGPGVMTYSDGRQDVGLWLGNHLLKLCTLVEESFSLNSFPEYAAFNEPSVNTGLWTQPQSIASYLHTKTGTDLQENIDENLKIDERFILLPGIERYCTDGDHLPLPPGRRRELDKLFYGELWEPDPHPYQGYKREPLSSLPLRPRMQAVIHRHRLQAENVGWNVAAVLSMNRESFGPKGPSEVNSELLIQHSFRGEFQDVTRLIHKGLVHPDVEDSRGHTALIAATINCHDDVIHRLLDNGVFIDKLNRDGMSALAVCHVLCYPFQSLSTALTEVLMSSSLRESSPHISQSDFTSVTPKFDDKSQSADINVKIQTDNHLSEQTAKDQSGHTSDNISKNTPAETEHLQEEERKEKEEDEDFDENESKEEERQLESACDQVMENRASEAEGVEDDFRKQENNEEVESASTETEIRKTKIGENEAKEDVKGLIQREERRSEKTADVGQTIQVQDGPVLLGTVWGKELSTKGKTSELTPKQTFDSACPNSSHNFLVPDEMLQRLAEALSHRRLRLYDIQQTITHSVRLNTLNVLLKRGADPNVARVPMPVLFFAIMAGDTEAVKRLLLSGAHADIPLPTEKKGLYPLHVAAMLPGPEGPIITELLLHAAIDPDAQACDQDDIYEPDRISMTAEEPLSVIRYPKLKEGGRTALHIACQRDTDYMNASKVVSLLLSHRASTDLLWSGHSPLSLAIASGNDLAVKELLNSGADPNIPLGSRVGSALCALTNMNYNLGSNRIKLLDMLATAGADILMLVTKGSVVGTAVDHGHYSYNQVLRDLNIVHTQVHTQNKLVRERLNAQTQLLSKMSDLMRQTQNQRETKNLERQQHLILNRAEALSSSGPTNSSEGISETTKDFMKPEMMFCYHCGRSALCVMLTKCGHCRKVLYCSKTCELKGWKERHKEECAQLSASADGIQKSVAFKFRRTIRTVPVMKSKTVFPIPNVTLTPLTVPKPLSKAEESPVNLKENYSCN